MFDAQTRTIHSLTHRRRPLHGSILTIEIACCADSVLEKSSTMYMSRYFATSLPNLWWKPSSGDSKVSCRCVRLVIILTLCFSLYHFLSSGVKFRDNLIVCRKKNDTGGCNYFNPGSPLPVHLQFYISTSSWASNTAISNLSLVVHSCIVKVRMAGIHEQGTWRPTSTGLGIGNM